jgi:subfamily B ATP-binding cassette protein MsbA
MKIFRRIIGNIKPYLLHLVGGGICLLLSSLLYPALLSSVKHLIDITFPKKDLHSNLLIFFLIIGISTFSGIVNFGHTYLISYVGQKIIIDLRAKLYSHLQFLSLSFFDKRKTGHLMSRITNDVSVLQNLVTSGIIDLFTSILTIIVLIIYIFILNWKLTLVVFIGFPFIAFSFSSFSRKIRKVSGQIQSKIADITEILQETLSSMKIVKSFAREKYEIEKFNKKNIESFKTTMKGIRYSAILTPFIQWIGFLGLAFAFYIGGIEVIQGRLTTGGLITFLTAVGLLAQPVRNLTRINALIQHSIACGERIFEILDTKPEVIEKENAIELSEVKGYVKFENVCFSYDGKKEVLKNINFTVSPGETVALVGHSGAGKTTLVNLIPRLYDPTKGRILIDGIDIKDIKIESLRKQIGIVPQDVILFGGTVEENIGYGKENATKEEIINAAKLANAHNFIIALPDGYNTIVGEKGLKLSGGERQRISIARAILKNPPILILDEATSSLDSISEALIQEALKRLMKGKTTFIIAHRLSTIKMADKIVVLENGMIKEIGNHEELFKKGKYYFNLYKKEEFLKI